MKKLIVCNAMSLDGYYEGPDKNVMPLFDYRWETYPTDDSFDVYNAERLRAADTLLLGRSSFEVFKGYWPSVAEDPKAAPVAREISRLNNAMEKVVVSDSLTSGETAPWTNTRILKRANAHQQIAGLKRQSGKDILVFGSRTLWSDLLAHGLVDELHLMITPVVVGSGTPMFGSQSMPAFRLIDMCTQAGSGNVFLRYEIGRRNVENR